MKDVKECPFCGGKPNDHWTWISDLSKDEPRYVLTHYCLPIEGDNFTVITIYGDSEEDVIERWNNRGKKYIADQ